MDFNALSRVFSLFDLAVQHFKDEKGLIGIDTGYRFVDKKPSNELAVRVHFFDRDPASLQKPSGGQAIQLLIYPRRPQLRADPISPWGKFNRLLSPGLSIGCLKYNGSIGLIGHDTRDRNKRAILTCQHLFKACRKKKKLVSQPLAKNTKSAFGWQIGRWKRRLPSSDAAIIHLAPTQSRRYRNEVKIGRQKVLKINQLRPVQMGEILLKAGCSTGITQAQVDGIGLFFPQEPGLPFSIPAFRLVPLPQKVYSPLGISAGGDSGAVWLDPKSGDGVGLHVAGHLDSVTSNSFAYALHLQQVCADIGFRLLT